MSIKLEGWIKWEREIVFFFRWTKQQSTWQLFRSLRIVFRRPSESEWGQWRIIFAPPRPLEPVRLPGCTTEISNRVYQGRREKKSTTKTRRFKAKWKKGRNINCRHYCIQRPLTFSHADEPIVKSLRNNFLISTTKRRDLGDTKNDRRSDLKRLCVDKTWEMTS